MSKKPKQRTGPAPRDPYWRTRHALGAKRKPGAKTYDRADSKATEREAQKESGRDSGRGEDK